MITVPALPSACGVYHLIRNGRVIYVGASVNVLSRVGAWHRAMPGEFTHWALVPCDKDELAQVEREHIERYNPPMNAAGRTRPYNPGGIYHVSGAVREHGSPRAYLQTCHALIGATTIQSAGLPLRGDELKRLPGFPQPAVARTHSRCRDGYAYLWHRDDVIAWFNGQEQSKEQEAA